MLRLTRLDMPTPVLRVEGRLAQAWVGVLEDECRGLAAEGHPLRLDLTGLSDVDTAGVALLQELQDGGATLEGSLLVRTLLSPRE